MMGLGCRPGPSTPTTDREGEWSTCLHDDVHRSLYGPVRLPLVEGVDEHQAPPQPERLAECGLLRYCHRPGAYYPCLEPRVLYPRVHKSPLIESCNPTLEVPLCRYALRVRDSKKGLN